MSAGTAGAADEPAAAAVAAQLRRLSAAPHPRPVRERPRGAGGMVRIVAAYAVMAVLAGAAVAVPGLVASNRPGAAERARVLREGTLTVRDGVVQGTSSVRSGGTGRSRVEDYVEYRYGERGSRDVKREKVPPGLARGLRRLDPVRVKVWELDGSRVVSLEGNESSLRPRVLPAWVPLPVAAVVLAAMCPPVVRRLRRRRLVIMGEAARGTVVEVLPARGTTAAGEPAGPAFTYSFRARGGAGPFTGRDRAGRIPPPSPGQALAVLYDPRDPGRSLAYDYAEYELADPPATAT